MSMQPNHILTIAHTADLDAVIAALDAHRIRVVCVDADVDTGFERVNQLTVRPTVQIDLPVIDYAVRRAGADLLDLRTSEREPPALCGLER